MSEWTQGRRQGFDPAELPQMIKQFLSENGFGGDRAARTDEPGVPGDAGERGHRRRPPSDGPFGAWGDDDRGPRGGGHRGGPRGGGPRGDGARGGRGRGPFGQGFGQGFGRDFGPQFAGLFGGPGGGWPGRGPRRGRGEVRLAVLALLAEEPRHGYQMIQEIETRSGGSWKPSPGSVYPTLQQLEDEALIRAEDVDGRRVFKLTDEGTAYVATKSEEIAQLWAAVAPEPAEGGDRLGELMFGVATAFFHVCTTGTATQRDQARDILARTRADLYKVLGEDDATAAGEIPDAAEGHAGAGDGAQDGAGDGAQGSAGDGAHDGAVNHDETKDER